MKSRYSPKLSHLNGTPASKVGKAREEKFLANNLGGRYEPMVGERVPGSTAIVKVIGN
jgi:hypothetical protein